jgi:hypothetical protein
VGSSIERLFKGGLATLTLRGSGPLTAKPERGHAWLVLGGFVHHITGTDTYLFAAKQDAISTELDHAYVLVPSAGASIDLPLFNFAAQTNGYQTQWTPYIITDDRLLTMQGAATAVITVEILDFPYG